MRAANTKSGLGLGAAIRAASEEKAKQEDQLSGLPENGKADASDFAHLTNEQVNLSIKVPKQLRVHWLIEAKKQGTSLTDAITDALNARFGAGPEKQ